MYLEATPAGHDARGPFSWVISGILPLYMEAPWLSDQITVSPSHSGPAFSIAHGKPRKQDTKAGALPHYCNIHQLGVMSSTMLSKEGMHQDPTPPDPPKSVLKSRQPDPAAKTLVILDLISTANPLEVPSTAPFHQPPNTDTKPSPLTPQPLQV